MTEQWFKKIFLLLIIGLVVVSPLYAEEAKKKIPIVVNGDKVEYFQDVQKVVGTGNVVVTYEDVELTCDKMTVYLDTKDGFAEGNVKMYQRDSIYSGIRGSYNFETKKGEMIKGDMDAHPWYGKGDVMKKVAATEYQIESGYVTTCDHIPSHYKIQSKEVQIFLDDKVTAKHCLMYVGKFPLFYLPYYAHPLQEDKPRVTIIPGYDSRWGAFVLSRWRYYFHEYMKGYVHVDYRERRDLGWGVDYKYDTRYVGEGLLRSYYMHERTIGPKRIWKKLDEEPGEFLPTKELERFKIQLRHKWQPTDNIDVNAEYHKFSDADFNREYFYRNYEMDESTPTYVSAIRQMPYYSAELRVDKRANHYDTEVERLPEFNLSIGANRLFNTNFYYESRNILSNLDKKYGNDSEEDLDAVRFDNYDSLSYLTKFLGFLSVSPFIATRQTYFTKNKWGEPDWIRGTFYSGVDMSTRFYKLFPYTTDILGLDINGLRHIISPSMSYSYNHHPTILPQNLMQFDSLDNIDRVNQMTLSVENKLQTKRKSAGKMQKIDLARLILSTNYLFKVERGSEFSNFDADLELKPYNWLYMEGDLSYNHLKDKVEKMGWDIVAEDPSGHKRWSLGIGHRYELEYSSQLTVEFLCQLTPKWKIKLYERYQGVENDFKEHQYTIMRDLHCWTVELTYDIYRPRGETIMLIFRTKAFPAAPVVFDTSYHQPKTRSQTFMPLP